MIFDVRVFVTMRFHLLIAAVLLIRFDSVTSAALPSMDLKQTDDAVVVRLADQEVARYVFRDKQVGRPYWAPLKTPSGIQVTRSHPPRKEQDAVDHPGLHTGVWLSFGDLNGVDYWRLKSATEHVRFPEAFKAMSGTASFAVENRYRTADGRGTVAEETCRYTLRTLAGGYLIEIDSEFRPGDADLVFGDQEEMGLGVRLATPLAVDRKQGGRMIDNAARRNGGEIWGQTVDWCDLAGPVGAGPLGGKWVGVTMMASPANFRASWCHARDYGFLALNPFGRKAFTKGEASRVVVRRGETLRLRFGVAVHESAAEGDFKPADVYREFAKRNAASKAAKP